MIITEKDAWMVGGPVKPRRTYVVTKRRDGESRDRRFIPQHPPNGTAVSKGRRAHKRGDARWANPYAHERARAWTYGWNSAHTKEKGVCPGCEQCGAGTAVPSESYVQWLKQWHRGDVQ